MNATQTKENKMAKQIKVTLVASEVEINLHDIKVAGRWASDADLVCSSSNTAHLDNLSAVAAYSKATGHSMASLGINLNTLCL